MSKRKPKLITLRFRKGDHSHNLLAATSRWIRANGGTDVVIGGIQVEWMPESLALPTEKYKYRVSVGVVGRRPTKKEKGDD